MQILKKPVDLLAGQVGVAAEDAAQQNFAAVAQIGDGLVEIVGGNSKGSGVIPAGQIDSRAL